MEPESQFDYKQITPLEKLYLFSSCVRSWLCGNTYGYRKIMGSIPGTSSTLFGRRPLVWRVFVVNGARLFTVVYSKTEGLKGIVHVIIVNLKISTFIDGIVNFQ